MELHCEFFETDEHGNICHAGDNDECPEWIECTAEYDVHGNRINEMAENERLRYGY